MLPKPTVFSGSKSGRTGGVLLPPPRSHEQPPPAAVGNASHKAVDDWAQDPDPFGSFSAAVSSTGKAAAVSSTDPFGAFGSRYCPTVLSRPCPCLSPQHCFPAIHLRRLIGQPIHSHPVQWRLFRAASRPLSPHRT